MPEQEQQALLERLFEEESRQVFDLERGPLLRLRIVRLGSASWCWFITAHHAIGDAQSIFVLGTELLQRYDGLLDGQPLQLPPLRASFRDVVAHLRAAADTPEQTRAWWASAFGTPWPHVRLVPPERETEATSSARTLTLAQSQRLRAWAKDQHRSLFTFFLTLWFRILKKRSGVSDQVVGVATSGRDLPITDIDQMFGCFATGLPVRTHLEGHTFDEDFEAVDRAFSEAYRHGDIPTHELARLVPRFPESPWPPGAAHFMSFMDFRSFDALRSPYLQTHWEQARLHYTATATDTQSLNVLLGERIRIHLHATLPEALQHEILDEVVAEIAAHTAEPRPTSEPPPRVAAPGLDAALICYLPAPADLQGLLPGSPDAIRHLVKARLFEDGEARLAEVLRSPYGVSGAVFIPWFADELMLGDRAHLARQVADAIEVAGAHGARSVSLAGMLPACLNYGFSVAQLLDDENGLGLTTGHAATVVAVVKTVHKVLGLLERPIGQSTLAVVGFGSIGQSSLNLLLEQDLRPQRLLVVEQHSQLRHLKRPIDALRARYGDLEVLGADGALPDEVYGADVLIGASSSGGIVDVSRLQPGTVLIDDSFPLIVDARQAVERMERARDVLIVGGGTLSLGECRTEVLVPDIPSDLLDRALVRYGAGGVPGCRAESLLVSARDDLPAIRGLVDPADAARFWRALSDLGLEAAPLHLGGYAPPEALIERVRQLS
jgi:predicted amino acid dehydrogenase